MEEFEFSVHLDKSSPIPLYRQIGDAVISFAEKGALPPDMKLPPIRRFADSLGVNNVTIVNAYKYLENKGVVYSITGSGTYISSVPVREFDTAISDFLTGRKKTHPPHGENVIDFSKGSTSKELFPVADFKRLFNEVLDKDRGGAFGYEESLGFLPLRESLCGYLKMFGIQAPTERIHVISGAQQGIDIAAKVLLSSGDVVLTERPTYFGAAAAFISRGAKLHDIPIEPDGIELNALTAAVKQFKPKLLYCMPNFQTPTCYSYSLEKKIALLELAYKYNFYIIEEDNLSDFNYADTEITPLKALDYKNRVIYVKSFSKILMPGLKIGFMLMPRVIAESALAAKYAADIDTSGFLQRAFHLFIDSGAFYAHRQNMRSIFGKKYRFTLNELNRASAHGLSFIPPEGGLNFWLNLTGETEPTVFFKRLEERGVTVLEGAGFMLGDTCTPGFKISFADIGEEQIAEGIKRIKETAAGK